MADTKKLYRRPKEGKLFGVVAGLAEYFEMDVTLLRVIFVVLVIAGAGFIIPIYLLLALLLPTNEAGAKAGVSTASVQSNITELTREFNEKGVADRSKHYLGIGLIILGAWLFLVQIYPEIFAIRWQLVWPAALVIIGVLLLLKRGGQSNV